ncbi:MAG: hypothetical protein WA709_36445, partial [Stellaceae bacterium]
ERDERRANAHDDEDEDEATEFVTVGKDYFPIFRPADLSVREDRTEHCAIASPSAGQAFAPTIGK